MITRQTISIQGDSLAYYDSGETQKPVLLFVHGVGASGRYMLPLADSLRDEYRVIALDFPGFGRSNKVAPLTTLENYAELHHALIGKLKVKGYALVGNSFGCQVIVEQLLRYPDDSKKLILLGPTINQQERSLSRQMWQYSKDVYQEPKRMRELKLLLKDYLEARASGVYSSLKIALNDSIEQKLHHLKSPILILRGSRDPIAPAEWVRQLAVLAPNARVDSVEGAHIINLTSTKQTSQKIRMFLKR